LFGLRGLDAFEAEALRDNLYRVGDLLANLGVLNL
jgi:hypothetical protein